MGHTPTLAGLVLRWRWLRHVLAAELLELLGPVLQDDAGARDLRHLFPVVVSAGGRWLARSLSARVTSAIVSANRTASPRC